MCDCLVGSEDRVTLSIDEATIVFCSQEVAADLTDQAILVVNVKKMSVTAKPSAVDKRSYTDAKKNLKLASEFASKAFISATSVRNDGGVVVVHCAAGLERTPMVCAYIMKLNTPTLTAKAAKACIKAAFSKQKKYNGIYVEGMLEYLDSAETWEPWA